jgi:hypothetical protein
MANTNAFNQRPAVARPEFVRPQKLADKTPRGTEAKQSALALVNTKIIFNQSGQSGGS